MAFGFGFNKQKVLNSAEKFVQQGKLQNAITEYEKILKSDPRDLTVLNTVGDLYSRLGQSDLAVECFRNVGDAYATQGFTVKAIAMYKKLTKLRPSLDCVLRLAELYTQQGLFNDARAQYKQVAEEFLRTGELEQAAKIFQKILEMDPENVAMRTKLAEVYVRLGKKDEAWQIFSGAVESLRARGSTGPAEEVLQRMLTLDPGNSEALLQRGQMAFEAGEIQASIECLEKVADLDSHADGLRCLFKAYMQSGRMAEAGTLAAKLIAVHNDVDSIAQYADALLTAGRFDDALQVYQQYSDRMLSGDSNKVLENLHALIGHVRGNTAALETLLSLLNRAGETTHVTEVYELLAHAATQSGDLAKARDYYLKLTQLEPQNAIHASNYQQVVNRLGEQGSTSLITVEEGTTLVDELEASAPFVEQRYPDDVALTIRSALTDAELFISYNMPSKALGPLLVALPKAPHDLRLNQRLAALHTRAGRFAEAAACCRILQGIYHEASYPEEASRYGELAAKYEERATPRTPQMAAADVDPLSTGLVSQTSPVDAVEPASIAALEPAASSALFSTPSAIPVHITPPATPAARAHGLFWHAPAAPAQEIVPKAPAALFQSPAAAAENEIDLSGEWEDALSGGSPAIETASAAAIEEDGSATIDDSNESVTDVVAEIRFYLKHGMTEQARAAHDRLRSLKPDTATLSMLEKEIDGASSAAPEAQAAEEVSIEDVEARSAEVPASVVEHTRSAAAAAVAPAKAAPWPEPQVAAAQAPAPAAQSNALGDFVSDLENSLGDSFLAPAAAANLPAARQQPAAQTFQAPSAIAASATAGVSTHAAAVAVAAAVGVPPSPLFSPQSQPPIPASQHAATTEATPGVDLSNMFGELRQELEEEAPAAGEDCETHYNLGVAFREMGLLDEAIGELQKVCQAVDRGNPFPQVMQSYTWLAQCFLDKGVPEAAIRWYEKALQLPNLDGETRTALHYELANAYELGQNKPWALKHFLEVYGSNIDYRDVSERIKALKS